MAWRRLCDFRSCSPSPALSSQSCHEAPCISIRSRTSPALGSNGVLWRSSSQEPPHLSGKLSARQDGLLPDWEAALRTSAYEQAVGQAEAGTAEAEAGTGEQSLSMAWRMTARSVSEPDNGCSRSRQQHSRRRQQSELSRQYCTDMSLPMRSATSRAKATMLCLGRCPSAYGVVLLLWCCPHQALSLEWTW